jgi:hypothetical protein
MPDEITPHEHSHPCNPPGGTMWEPGPCSVCGKSYDLAVAEAQLARAQAAVEAAKETSHA